jgi:hypothetical protein
MFPSSFLLLSECHMYGFFAHEDIHLIMNNLSYGCFSEFEVHAP